MAEDSSPLLVANGDANDRKMTFVKQPVSKSPFTGKMQMRYVIAFLCLFGAMNIYSTRMSLSMALVCMVNHTAVLNHTYARSYTNSTTSPICHPDEVAANVSNKIANEDGPFMWDEELQGIILSSFFWGYVTTQFAGGYIADKWGGKWIWGITLLASSLLTMMIPAAAYISPTMLVAVRFLCGVAQGFTFPVVFSIISKWTTQQERARFLTVCSIGVPMGMIIAYPISAVFCTSTWFGGWPAIFYLFGFLGIVWFVLWIVLMTSHPSDNPWISQKEKQYIEDNNMCELKPREMKIPWLQLLTSIPVWAICMCDMGQSFKGFMLMTQLPTYLRVVMNFNLQQNGIINTVPMVIGIVVAYFCSWGADIMKSKKTTNINVMRKMIILTQVVLTCAALLGVVLISCGHRIEIVALLWIQSVSESLNPAGFDMVPYDMAPNFAGTIKGMVQTCSAAAGIAAPYVVGLLINHNNTKASWNIAFAIAIGVSAVGGLIFFLFGNSTLQTWNTIENVISDDDEDKDENNDNDENNTTIYDRQKLVKGK